MISKKNPDFLITRSVSRLDFGSPNIKSFPSKFFKFILPYFILLNNEKTILSVKFDISYFSNVILFLIFIFFFTNLIPLSHNLNASKCIADIILIVINGCFI